ncbi:unnamed protein product [Coregonus sp. 'balchen']|nr:unnamed protein product [Coregonus sp. 'balchen']
MLTCLKVLLTSATESVITQSSRTAGALMPKGTIRSIWISLFGLFVADLMYSFLYSSLQMKPYNIYVTIAYPPDTDTPGLAEENRTKPLETRLISETSGVTQPEQVAKIVVKDAVQGNFNSSVGPDGYMLSALTCGMSPVTSITEGLQQIVTMGLFRTIALFYLGSFDSIVRRCMIEREQSKAVDKRE